MNSLLNNIIVPLVIATSSATSTPAATTTPPVATTTPPQHAPEPAPATTTPPLPPAATSTPPAPTTTPPVLPEPPAEAPASSTPTTTPAVWNPFDSSFLSTVGAATRNAYALSQKLPPETTRLLLQIAVAAGIAGFFLVEQSILRTAGIKLRQLVRPRQGRREAVKRT